MNKKLNKACKIALIDYLGLQKNESLLVISDFNKREIGLALYDEGRLISSNCLYVEIKPQLINGEEPANEIAELMKKFDVVICPTTKSLTHTNARREASALGTRVVTMPGITTEIMSRCLSADAETIVNLSNKLTARLQGVKSVRVTTPLGTDITLPIEGRKILPSTGVLKNKGDSGNLPSGEVYMAPLERKSNGSIVFDGSIAGIGVLEKPITIQIKNGNAIKFSGGSQAKKFEKMLSEVGGDAFSIAELGIGTNHKAKISGIILEDEKVLGTVHIAFGNNKSMGGSIDVPIHIDGLIKSPDMYFDGELVMKKGKLIL